MSERRTGEYLIWVDLGTGAMKGVLDDADGKIGRRGCRKLTVETGEQEQCADSFEREGEQQNVSEQGMEVGLRAVGEHVLDQKSGTERHRASHGQNENGGKGHDADAAELNQGENDQLSPEGELRADVDDRQAGDAGGRGRHEESVDE